MNASNLDLLLFPLFTLQPLFPPTPSPFNPFKSSPNVSISLPLSLLDPQQTMSSTFDTKKTSTSPAVVPDVASRVEGREIVTPVPIKTSDRGTHHHNHHNHRRHQQEEEEEEEQQQEEEQKHADQLHHHQHHLLHKYKSSGDEDDNSDDSDDSISDACCPRSPITFGPSPTVDDKHSLARLLKNNRMWSKAIRERQPDFFEKCSKGQQPKVFWIGCSDSRVPENELLQLGELPVLD